MALLDPSPVGSRTVVVTQGGAKVHSLKKKSGKHNMAKGALPPEVLAVSVSVVSYRSWTDYTEVWVSFLIVSSASIRLQDYERPWTRI